MKGVIDLYNKKYIITKDVKPLYALRANSGPEKGPLLRPTPVKIEVIKDILLQKDPPALYEVIPENPQLSRYSTPVKLTLENYDLPYETNLAHMLGQELANKDRENIEIPIGSMEAEPIVTTPISETEEQLKQISDYKIPEVVSEENDGNSGYTDEELAELEKMGLDEDE